MDKELINNAMAPIYDKLVSIDNKLDSLMMLSGLFMIANNNLVPEEQRMQALNKAMDKLGLDSNLEVKRDGHLATDMII